MDRSGYQGKLTASSYYGLPNIADQPVTARLVQPVNFSPPTQNLVGMEAGRLRNRRQETYGVRASIIAHLAVPPKPFYLELGRDCWDNSQRQNDK